MFDGRTDRLICRVRMAAAARPIDPIGPPGRSIAHEWQLD